MTSPQKPPDIVTPRAILKANLIGVSLLFLFVVSAGIVYLLMGLIGWEAGAARILLAMMVGPFIVGIGFGLWWRSIHTRLHAPDKTPPIQQGDSID